MQCWQVEKWFDTDVTEPALRFSIDKPSRTLRSNDLLTKREAEIVELVCQGLRNRDIAARCDLAEGTVKIHLNSISASWALRHVPTLSCNRVV